MGKDKKRKITENEKKETLFYFEMMGVILIVISAVLILQLGQIGYWLYVLFKVLFGDYYFIYVFLMMYIGFYSLFFHKAFNIKNQRFIGFIFMGISVMIFCHIPVHNYILEKEGSYFHELWSVYYTFLSLGYGEVLGGGMLGGVIFYLSFKMFGLLGVCLIATIIIVLGFSLLVNKPIGELVSLVFKKIKSLKKATSNFNNFFKYEIGNQIESSKNIYNLRKQIPMKFFEDYDNSIQRNFQVKISNENKILINSILNTLKLEYKEVEMIVSYKVTTYKYIIFSNFDMAILLKKLKEVIDEKILFGKNSNKVVIQINNSQEQSYSFKEMISTQSNLYENNIIPLGIDSNNKIAEIDLDSLSGILIISKTINEELIINIITMMLLKNPFNCYEVHCYEDINSSHKEIDKLNKLFIFDNDLEILELMKKISENIDFRLKELDLEKVNNINEYNKKIEIDGKKVRFKRLVYIININHISNNNLFEERLFYILSSAQKTGINILLNIFQDSVSNIVISLFDYKIIFKNNLFINPFPNSKSLIDNYDGLFYIGSKENRITLPKMTEKEYERIKKYID